MNKEPEYIYRYLKNWRTGRKEGMIVAANFPAGIRVGISICNVTDTFDRETGIKVALERAEKSSKIDMSFFPARDSFDDAYEKQFIFNRMVLPLLLQGVRKWYGEGILPEFPNFRKK